MTPGRYRPAQLAFGLVASALLACGASVANLPTHDLLLGSQSAPTGTAAGTLVARGDCVFLQGDPESLLVIWPRGFDRIGQQITDRGNPVVQVGEALTLFGGPVEASQYERLRSSIGGSAVSASCKSARYWLATGIELPEDD